MTVTDEPSPEQYEDDKDDEDPEEEQFADQLPGNGANRSGSPTGLVLSIGGVDNAPPGKSVDYTAASVIRRQCPRPASGLLHLGEQPPSIGQVSSLGTGRVAPVGTPSSYRNSTIPPHSS